MGKDQKQDQNLSHRRICNPTFHNRSRLLPHADIFFSPPRRRHTTGRRSSLRLLTGRRSSLRLFLLLKATGRPVRSSSCCPAGSCCCCWPAGSCCCCCPAGSCCCCCWPARSCSLPAAPCWRSSWLSVDFLLIRFFCRWFDYSGELKRTAGVAAAAGVCRFPFLRGEGEGAAGVGGCCTAAVSRDFVFAGFFGVLFFYIKFFGPPKFGSA